MSRKYSKKYFINLAKQKGFRLSSEFLGLQNHLLIKCIKCSFIRKLARARFLLDCDIYCKPCYKTADFIKHSNITHNNKYDYSLAKYINYDVKIKIICRDHGIFKQTPYNHKSRSGCPKCSLQKKTLSEDEFINLCKKIHGNKYDYKLVKYISNKSKVQIICEKHGVFEQRADAHKGGQGCSKCMSEGQRTTNKDFIDRSNKVHDSKYSYSKCKYIKLKKKVKITCKIHGDFLQHPSDHLNGSGCKKCVGRISKKETDWLDSFNIKIRNKIIWLNSKKYIFADGLDEETNTIYEFYGDYWHGNPNVYDQDKNCFTNQTFGDFYKRTIKREKLIKKAGYNLVTIWESDYDSK